MNTKLAAIFILSLAIMAVSAADRGLAWPWNNVAQDFGLFQGSPAIKWVYNWESWVPEGKPDNLEYVAMQRTRDFLDQLPNNMQNNGARILLGFNEPDIAAQANMGVDEAVGLWRQHILPYGQQGIRLGSPATSNSPQGLPWLQEFMSKCNDCMVDFIAMHWYGLEFSEFQAYVEAVHNAFPDKKIWVTEFALTLDIPEEQQRNFLGQALPYLDSLDYVERYAWFGASRGSTGNSLINDGGELTAVGQSYVGTSGLAAGSTRKIVRRCLRRSGK